MSSRFLLSFFAFILFPLLGSGQTSPAVTASVSDVASGEIELTLTSAIPDVEIYYTLDGSVPDPDNNGQTVKYTLPLILTQGSLITADFFPKDPAYHQSQFAVPAPLSYPSPQTGTEYTREEEVPVQVLGMNAGLGEAVTRYAIHGNPAIDVDAPGIPENFTLTSGLNLKLALHLADFPTAEKLVVTYEFPFVNPVLPVLEGDPEDPNDSPVKVVHLAADQGFYLDGEGYAVWESQTSNGLELRSSSGSYQPTKELVNGQHVIRFNSFHTLVFSEHVFKNLFGSDGAELFVVLNPDLDPGVENKVLFYGYNEGKSRYLGYQFYSANDIVEVSNHFGTKSKDSIPVNSSWGKKSHLFNAELGELAVARVNGTELFISPNPSLLHPNIWYNTAPLIGRKNSSWYYEGDISEILVFDRAISAGERSTVETYLMNKYHLETALPEQPKNFEARALGGAQVLLTWENDDLPSGREYEISRISDVTTDVWRIEEGSSFIDSSLVAGEFYEYRIREVNSLGVSVEAVTTIGLPEEQGQAIPFENLHVWLRADDIPAGSVGIWKNAGARGDFAGLHTDSTSSMPLRTRSAYSDIPMVQFESSDTLVFSEHVFKDLFGSNGAEIFVVSNPDMGGEENLLFYGYNGGKNLYLEYSYDSGNSNLEISNQFGTKSPYTISMTADEVGIAHLYNAAFNEQPIVRINGKQTTVSGTTFPALNPGNWSNSLPSIGRVNPLIDYTGSLYEILIFDRSLTGKERYAVTYYLNQKYSLTDDLLFLMLPESHDPFTGEVTLYSLDPEVTIYYTVTTDGTTPADPSDPGVTRYNLSAGERSALDDFGMGTPGARTLTVSAVAVKIVDGVEVYSEVLTRGFTHEGHLAQGTGITPVYQNRNSSGAVDPEHFLEGTFSDTPEVLDFLNNGAQIFGQKSSSGDARLNYTDARLDTAPTSPPGIPGGIDAGNFNVVWEGELIPRYTEALTLNFLSKEEVSFYLDLDQDGLDPEDLFLSGTTPEPKTFDTAVGGQSYAFKIIYQKDSDTTNDAQTNGVDFQLFWQSESVPEQLIPATQLIAKHEYTNGNTRVDLHLAYEPDIIPVSYDGSALAVTEQELQMTSATPGARIRYTLDGSEPTLNSLELPLLQTLVIDAEVALRVRAFDVQGGGKDPSDIFNILHYPDAPTADLSGLEHDGNPLTETVTAESGLFQVTATVDSGSSVKEIHFTLVTPDNESRYLGKGIPGVQDIYQIPFDALSVPDGEYTLKVDAETNLGIRSSLAGTFTLQLEAPPVPLILSPGSDPANMVTLGDDRVTIQGTARPDASITFETKTSDEEGAYEPLTSEIPVAGDGTFEFSATFTEAPVDPHHMVRVKAVGRNGLESAWSNPALFRVDTSLPPSPANLQVRQISNGGLRLDWEHPVFLGILDAYHVQRSDDGGESWEDLVTLAPDQSSYEDHPPTGVAYQYRILSENKAAATTEPNTAAVTSSLTPDDVPPTFKISYSPGTGTPTRLEGDETIFGSGFVNILVETDEPLSATPSLYFSKPGGGVPLTATLYGSGNLFQGVVALAAEDGVTAGECNAQIHGWDMAGNRGDQSNITEGASLFCDVQGPVPTNLDTINRLYDNSGSQHTLVLDLVLNETPLRPQVEDPDIFGLSLGGAPELIDESQSPDMEWIEVEGQELLRVTVPLNSDAGLDLPDVEEIELATYDAEVANNTLNIHLTLTDDFGNVSALELPGILITKNLPFLRPPTVFHVQEQPDAEVTLSWYPVFKPQGSEADKYALYFKDGDNLHLIDDFAALGQPEYTHTFTSEVEGNFTLVLSAMDDHDNDAATEMRRGYGTPFQVVFDETPPGAATMLTAELVPNTLTVEVYWSNSDTLPGNEIFLYRWVTDNPADVNVNNLDAALLVKEQMGPDTNKAYDPRPVSERTYYAVVTKDSHGNLALASEPQFTELGLIAPPALNMEFLPGQEPRLSWTPVGAADSYAVYAGNTFESSKVLKEGLLNPEMFELPADIFPRTYWVAAYANDNMSAARSLMVPAFSASFAEGSKVSRGLPAPVYVEMEGVDPAVFNYQLHMVLDPDGATPEVVAGKLNEPFVVLATNLTGDELDVSMQLSLHPVSDLDAGNKISYFMNATLPVEDASPSFEIKLAELIPGSVLNKGDIQVEVINPSPESITLKPIADLQLRFLDNLGREIMPNAGVLMPPLTLHASESGILEDFAAEIPLNIPPQVIVEAVLDRYSYLDGDGIEHIVESPLNNRLLISTTPVSYHAQFVTTDGQVVYPGDALVFQGEARSVQNNTPMAAVPVLLTLQNGSYRKSHTLTTNPNGEFSYEFFVDASMPGGEMRLEVKHPDLMRVHDPEAASRNLTVRKIAFTPSRVRKTLPLTAIQSLPLELEWDAATPVSRLSFRIKEVLPSGFTFTLPEETTLTTGDTHFQADLLVSATESYDLANRGEEYLTLELSADFSADGTGEWVQVGEISMDFNLIPAYGSLSGPSSLVQVGVKVNESNEVETPGSAEIRFINNGLLPLHGLRARLFDTEGNEVRDSILSIQSPNPDLEIDEEGIWRVQTQVDTLPPGSKDYTLVITSDEGISATANLTLIATTEATSRLSVHVVNAFYKAPEQIDGVALDQALLTTYKYGVPNARVTLERQDFGTGSNWLPPEPIQGRTHDAPEDQSQHGIISFDGVTATAPAPGRYRVIVEAPGHVTAYETVDLKPGVGEHLVIAVEYGTVTLEWEVREITIEDRYEVEVETTFYTVVPAPTIVVTPELIQLPAMCVGDVFDVELTIENKGLVTAKNLESPVPESSTHYRVTDFSGLPERFDLGARQSRQVAFRYTCIKNHEGSPCAGESQE